MGTYQFQAIPVRQMMFGMGQRARRYAFVLGLSLFAAPALGQTNNSYPMLMSLKPTAAQIGQSTEHELNARYNLAGATQIIVSGGGVEGVIVPNEQEKPEDQKRNDVMASKCKIKFTVAPDAVPGVRDFRIVTPHGVSTVGQLVLARDAILSEAAENDTLEKAQVVNLPATLCGAMEKAEDVDWFKFHVEAGTSLTFHVRSQRLLNRLHDMQIRIDPMITVRTADGATLAASDNYYAGDPLLHYRFERTGDYALEVRDVRYQGNADWVYSIEVNSRPFVTQASPMAIAMGTPSPVSLVGYNLLPDAKATLLAELGSKVGMRSMAAQVGDQWTNDFGVFVTDGPLVVEPTVSPSTPAATDGTTASPAATPVPVATPSVLAGCISKPGEIDRFVFEAKAQDRLTFEVFARRLNSAIDPKIKITNEQGGVISEADDATFQRVINADSWLENWTAPADGKYILEVHDLHQRGGPQFTYAVQIQTAKPYFLLEADTDKTLLAPGMGSVVFVRALRKNGFAGDIDLAVEGLPNGVTVTTGKILANSIDGAILLHATPEAAKGAANITILGKGTHAVAGTDSMQLTSTATIMQEYYSPGGGRGHHPVDIHTVSVEEPVDIRGIKMSQTDIHLKPGESQRIDVEIERAPDFKGNVTLDMIYQHLEQPYGNSLPKGVSMDVANSKTLLTGTDTKGHITLKAAPDAPEVANQISPLNVHISINFVMKHTFCGSPISISVAK